MRDAAQLGQGEAGRHIAVMSNLAVPDDRPKLSSGQHGERIRALLAYGWLSETSDSLSEAVIAAGVWKKVERGVRLFRAGDIANDVVGLAEGVVSITSVADFEEDALLHICRPPTWLGWQVLTGDRFRKYTATTKTTSWVLKVPRRALVSLLDQDSRGWAGLMPLAASYKELGATAAEDLLIRNSEQRVIAVLLRLCGYGDPMGGPRLHSLPITQNELASATNLSRNSVISILQGLEARKIIRLGKCCLVVDRALALDAMQDASPIAGSRWREGGKQFGTRLRPAASATPQGRS